MTSPSPGSRGVTALALGRFLLPFVVFVVLTGAVATALFRLNVYANDHHDAALALVQVEASVSQEEALANLVDGHDASFSASVDLSLQAHRVRVELAALGSRHVDAADAARIQAAYHRYEAMSTADDAQALNSFLAATSREWASGGTTAGNLAGGLSSGLVVVVAVVTAMALRGLGRRRSSVAAHGELVQRARSFRALFDDNPQPMFVWEKGTFRILAANRAAVAQYGYTQDELTEMSIPDLRWPEESTQFHEIAGAIAVQGRRDFQGIRHRTKEGRSFNVEIQVREVDFEGRHTWLTVIDDVTERIGLHRELEHQAFHDSLTGLPNRALFYDRVEHVHRRLLRSSSRYAVLLLDLDNFKTVNDSFGHAAGDELLLEVSRRLAGGVRSADTAARLGGDEFGVVLEDLEDEREAVTVADHLLAALRQPLAVAGRSVTLSATIGIALSGGATGAATDVVRNADIALYVGKARGKDRQQLYSGEMHAAVLGRITLEQELREGISRGEFVVHYQPKVDSWSGRVVGVEALVRWNHPVRGLLAPDAFIAVAEESGLIVDLDAWVLETACRQGRAWERDAGGRLSIAVNVSGRDLEGAGLVERVRRVLGETGLDPQLLELELTESVAVQQQEEALSMLRELRAFGVRIAIDDFGTGYSMLGRLQDFPFDTLKIDGSFISRITTLDADSPIVSATVAMARGLGLEVVAEGVQTEQQRLYLVGQGCAQLQGYLISPPIGPEQIPPMLRVPPLPPIEDPRWAALESAVGVASAEPVLEDLVRGLLVELQRLTGLESVYLTRIHWERDEQEVVFSRNIGSLTVPEHLFLPWPDTLSRGAPTADPLSPDRLPGEVSHLRAATVLGQQTSVSVPVLLGDGSIFGTLCGASGRCAPLAQQGLEVMRIFASLIAAQIAAPERGSGRRTW